MSEPVCKLCGLPISIDVGNGEYWHFDQKGCLGRLKDEVGRLRSEVERSRQFYADAHAAADRHDDEKTALRAEIERLRAEIERLRREMTIILPVLESLEREKSAWVWHTMGTGVATLNGYRRALEQQQ